MVQNGPPFAPSPRKRIMPRGVSGRSIIICLDCGEEAPLCAKGLCRPCYRRQYKRPIRVCGECGEERPYQAIGLCHVCYKARYNPHYYNEHRQEILAQKRRYYQTNREAILAKKRLYHGKHRKERLAYLRHWKNKNPNYMRFWYKKNPEKVLLREARRRAQKRRLPDTLTPAQTDRLLVIGRATYPGEALHLDHIVPLSKGGGTTYANMHAIPRLINIGKKDKLPEEIYQQMILGV